MVEFSLPRGMRDVSPEEWESSEVVRDAFVDTCNLFDYKIMEPSTLELLETLEAKSGPGIKNEIYFFKDKSERDLGLRFDLTVGMTRYVTSKRELSPPVRLGAFSSMWRYDEPQYGRYRWFYQWDIELFGPSNSDADAEIIEFTYLLFKKLGTSPSISMGSRKILDSYIRDHLDIKENEKIQDVLRAVDKLSKKSLDEIAEEYQRSATKGQLESVIDFAKLMGEPSKVADRLLEKNINASQLFDIIDSLKSRNVTDVELNLSIVRGIDYYTDMVFEAFDKQNPRLGSLCGGGRYDSLPAIYGRPDLGATGVAGGVERAMLAYKFGKGKERKIVYVAPIGSSSRVRKTSVSIASKLRASGVPAQSDITGKSLRKILETQALAGTTAVVIVGERELEENSVKVKWMKTGEEITVKLTDLESMLGGI